MKYLFTYNYICWLKKFRAANAKDKSAVQKSTALIAELPNVESIEQLNSLLSKYTDRSKDSSLPVYGPGTFYAQLANWQDDLKKINTSLLAAKNHLDELKLTPQNESLIRFLNELINTPKALLHMRTRSILETLRHECLPELIDFITNLATAPYPTHPRPNDFAAIKPVNSDHKDCLCLLNNIAASYKESDVLYMRGNSLLQSSLIVFQDLQMEEVNLEDEEPFIPPPPKEENSCIII